MPSDNYNKYRLSLSLKKKSDEPLELVLNSEEIDNLNIKVNNHTNQLEEINKKTKDQDDKLFLLSPLQPLADKIAGEINIEADLEIEKNKIEEELANALDKISKDSNSELDAIMLEYYNDINQIDIEEKAAIEQIDMEEKAAIEQIDMEEKAAIEVIKNEKNVALEQIDKEELTFIESSNKELQDLIDQVTQEYSNIQISTSKNLIEINKNRGYIDGANVIIINGPSSGSANGGPANGGPDNSGSANGGPDNSGSANGGPDNSGSANGGPDNSGSANGGSANGGSANGGSANGGPVNGGSANGGSANGGSANELNSKLNVANNLVANINSLTNISANKLSTKTKLVVESQQNFINIRLQVTKQSDDKILARAYKSILQKVSMSEVSSLAKIGAKNNTDIKKSSINKKMVDKKAIIILKEEVAVAGANTKNIVNINLAETKAKIAIEKNEQKYIDKISMLKQEAIKSKK